MSALVLLAASTAFGVLAHNMKGLADQPEAQVASGKLFLAFAVAGSLIALLMLLSPDKDKEHRSPGPAHLSTVPLLAGLCVLVIGYALTLETLGFLVSTSLFLALGYFLLGERRWWPVLATSVPVAVVLEILIYGVFGIAIADPLLHMIGFSA